ncbi:hypothetical protein FQN60_017239 [Etheostoma spectabile]|uniref:Uncharacterized protein n=1 Tax=Etheostoma spectabile TaxID=54343 RepID=A0A5J5DEW9_9PERO|nr:hypothetical protein FQN60_017239 [Etheostoma spectabile]
MSRAITKHYAQGDNYASARRDKLCSPRPGGEKRSDYYPTTPTSTPPVSLLLPASPIPPHGRFPDSRRAEGRLMLWLLFADIFFQFSRVFALRRVVSGHVRRDDGQSSSTPAPADAQRSPKTGSCSEPRRRRRGSPLEVEENME